MLYSTIQEASEKMKLYTYPDCPHFDKPGCTISSLHNINGYAIRKHCGQNCRRDSILRFPRFAAVGSILFLCNWLVVWLGMNIFHLGSFMLTVNVTLWLSVARYYLQLWIGYAR